MTLEEALARIAELEGEANGLKDEKTALLRKRDELLGKLKKFQKFEAYADQDVEELIRIKDLYEASETDAKSKYESLYQKDKTNFESRLAQIEKDRETEKQERQREKETLIKQQTESAAILEFSKQEYNIVSPKQLYRLVGDRVRLNAQGEPVVGDEYKEEPLGDFLKSLKDDPEYFNQFKANGANGSGSLPTQGNLGAVATNPWKRETFNLTLQGKITKENPKLAESLKASAGAK